jgi:hypothetical protein
MKRIPLYVLAILLSAAVASAEGLSISLSSDDSATVMGPRRNVRDARMAIRTRDGSTMLLLLDDAIAIQLTDAALAKIESEKKDPGFLEELLTAGVRLAVGKSVEYPAASIRSIEFSQGTLRILNDRNQPVFTNLKVNGTDVLRDFTSADAARFASAFRARKAR